MRGGFLVGLAIGAGAALAGPTFWRSARPAAKKAMRAGFEGYIVARQAAARMAEEVEDLIAEVSHEMTEAANNTQDDVIRSGDGAAGKGE
ncbi:hypothetical protein MB02_06235 [Croceicoccus estronivorus]|uniref:DUF5132 domain-containing protein n=1 Tax=Croceicoccus estronivorus TaxID=1172626 RepID=UPI00083469C9|nr:DUF5132 domain-containing protein [Croceicoccus estronivorus]OCC25029.1 hypothetical protein MB02_06235 [Croceicoccus estronivorus]